MFCPGGSSPRAEERLRTGHLQLARGSNDCAGAAHFVTAAYAGRRTGGSSSTFAPGALHDAEEPTPVDLRCPVAAAEHDR